jgi:hypothetical protein
MPAMNKATGWTTRMQEYILFAVYVTTLSAAQTI